MNKQLKILNKYYDIVIDGTSPTIMYNRYRVVVDSNISHIKIGDIIRNKECGTYENIIDLYFGEIAQKFYIETPSDYIYIEDIHIEYFQRKKRLLNITNIINDEM